MAETQPLKQQRSMVTKSPTKRKPFADLTNTLRKPNPTSSFIQSKKPASSTASDSSIGSTQNPTNVHRPVVVPVPPDQRFPSKPKPQRLTADHLAGEENQTAQTRRPILQNTRNKTTAAVPFYQTSSLGRKNNVKETSVSHCSSTLDKIKDQGKKINQSSTEKIKDKEKPVDVPLSAHHMTRVRVNNSLDKDKDKENVVPPGNSLAGNTNSNSGYTMPDSLMKRKDKGKAIAEPLDYLSRKKLKNDMLGFGGPLKGVVIKERGDNVTGSGSVNLAQKEKGKKDQQSSCPPILRTMRNRSAVDETEDVLHSKLQTEPPPNKKKRRYATKQVDEQYALSKEFVEQQRAYFKEIDDFELEVEEV